MNRITEVTKRDIFDMDLKNFESHINSILNLNDIDYQLTDGRLINKFDLPFKNNNLEQVPEVGVKELLQEAINYYNEDNLQVAVEKLWDAFERIKTFYNSPTIDKKKSVTKVISNITNGQKAFEELFEKEFQALTAIGNDYRINKAS